MQPHIFLPHLIDYIFGYSPNNCGPPNKVQALFYILKIQKWTRYTLQPGETQCLEGWKWVEEMEDQKDESWVDKQGPNLKGP